MLEAQPSPEAFEQLLGSLLEAGVRLIQLRDKSASDAVMLDRGRRAMALAHRIDGRSPAIVLINDRVAVAAAAGVDGVHLGAADLPVAEARRILGPGRLIGRTAHDLAEACAAQAAGADCLGIGPCYPSATKSFAEQAPRDFLRDTAAGIPLPLFAIGGITPERLPELAALGIHRVAVAAAVTAAPDPAAAAREFLAALALATRPPDHEPSSSARRLSQGTGRQGTTAANDSGNPLGPA
ncbi:MAG: Thiamine-phosphate synthase [Planctomycetota bacterium]